MAAHTTLQFTLSQHTGADLRRSRLDVADQSLRLRFGLKTIMDRMISWCTWLSCCQQPSLPEPRSLHSDSSRMSFRQLVND
jgi:hypothetical protein